MNAIRRLAVSLGPLLLAAAEIALAVRLLTLAADPEQDSLYAIAIRFGAGLLLSAAACALIAAARRWRNEQAEAAARAEFPAEPWHWRRDWREKRIHDRAGRGSLSLRYAVLPLSISALAIAALLFQAWAEWFDIAAAALLLPVALWQLWDTLLEAMDPLRFGRIELGLAENPLHRGGMIEGVIYVGKAPEKLSATALELVCVRRAAGSGLLETELGKQRWAPPAQAFTRRGNHLLLRVSASLPADWPASDSHSAGGAVAWELRLDGEVPGPNLRAEFPLPVFSSLQKADAPPDIVATATRPS